jgi:hypothetical protein
LLCNYYKSMLSPQHIAAIKKGRGKQEGDGLWGGRVGVLAVRGRNLMGKGVTVTGVPLIFGK